MREDEIFADEKYNHRDMRHNMYMVSLSDRMILFEFIFDK